MNTQSIASIREIADHYDAFLIDLWGVMHDGSALYDGAKAAIDYLHEQKKQVIFLSNAPRKAIKAIETLEHLGIERRLYAHLVTSGQAAHDMLAATNEWGKRYYYLGPGKDEDVLDDLPYTRCDDAASADFILNAGFEYDYQPTNEIEPVLKQLKRHQLPLLCINPDQEVVKQDGTRLLCAGWVAQRYQALGGKVSYIGKPHPDVYRHCLSLLGRTDKSSLLAIGDNLLTDILGAHHMGIDSLLITGGIMRSEQGSIPSPATLHSLYTKAGVRPTYVAEAFAA